MKSKYIISFCLVAASCISCKKDWLEAKSDKSIYIPTTLEDCQLLLDNTGLFNSQNYPGLLETGSADYFVSHSNLLARGADERNAYLWNNDIFEDKQASQDWDNPYNQVYNANVILEVVDKIHSNSTSEQIKWRNIKAGSLFHRAFAFYSIAQGFCKEYQETTASTDLGIPLRLNSDFNEHSARSTTQQTYERIITDLKEANNLIDNTFPNDRVNKLRPTKTAVTAMLARVFLSMEKYDSAFHYADMSLQLYSTLMDFNNISPTPSAPIQIYNAETIFHTIMVNYLINRASNATVDSSLYQSYSTNDLRKNVFFKTSAGRTSFCGSYSQSVNTLFCGLSTNEVYLIRAECYSRKGDVASAMNDLNTLSTTRWKTGTFIPFNAVDSEEALSLILNERRKELCFRGLRWSDLRRLNKDPIFQTTLSRNVNGQIYNLPPNDIKYILPIPSRVIQFTGIMQNIR